MLATSPASATLAVRDLAVTNKFCGELLGLRITEAYGGNLLRRHITGGMQGDYLRQGRPRSCRSH